MKQVASLVVGFVALQHLAFLVLEMFLWTSPVGLRTFGLTLEQATSSAALAANQGLYNGFLAAGLIWGLLSGQRPVKVFFLTCVLVAGVFGAITAKGSILIIQGLPALVGLVAVMQNRERRL